MTFKTVIKVFQTFNFFLRLFLHRSSLYCIEMFIKSNWNAQKLKWLDQNFCQGGHCAVLFRPKFDNITHNDKPVLLNNDLKVLQFWHGTLQELIAVPFCAVWSGFCSLAVDCGRKKCCQILEVLAYPMYLTIKCLSRNIKVEGSKLSNVKHQKSILLERCLCALSIGDFSYVL